MVANRETRIKQAKEYVKSNIWKQFLKQKIYELVLLPLIILSIWKVPSWIGWGIIKLFNIDPATNKLFCNTDMSITSNPCISSSEFMIWVFGLLVLSVIGILIYANWRYAESKLQDEAIEKYDLYYNELEDI